MTWRDLLRARPHWPSVGRTLAALALAGGLVGASVMAFGLYNVSARVGHLPGVSWVLHTTFRNSVDLRASAEPPEDLRSDAMIALGAGHFDTACAGCHAAPGQERSATVRAMVPEPPHITEAVAHWDPAEFHWIVHEGVKMSGMPAWPATREDDVWPVVSFLLAVPEMDKAGYEDLTARPEGQYCAMCHGPDGVSGNPHIPRLDILSERYIADTLAAYREGRRDSGIMAQAMSTVPADTIPGLARAFARTAPTGTAGPPGELEERGRDLATEGESDEVPVCRACHGPWPEPLNPAFPSLAGQYEPYLAQQLKLWRDSDRGGSRVSGLMHEASRDLTDADIAALAAYYASLAPAKLNDQQD